MDFLKRIYHQLREDYSYQTFLTAGAALVSTFVFALYNAYLGVRHLSLWNGSISVYYILLSVIRGVLIRVEARIHRGRVTKTFPHRRNAFYSTSIALFILNLALIVPVTLMVKLEKPVIMGLIPAIVMAAYTVYKVMLSVYHLRRSRASENLFVKELRAINMIDALLSIITLQNALLSVKGAGQGMMLLSMLSSAVLMLMIVAVTVRFYLVGRKQLQKG